jgi:hypothetical protein
MSADWPHFPKKNRQQADITFLTLNKEWKQTPRGWVIPRGGLSRSSRETDPAADPILETEDLPAPPFDRSERW